MLKMYIKSLLIISFFFMGCAANAISITHPDCLTIDDIYHMLKVPGACGKKSAGEGRKVCVSGYIDWHNVFDKKHYPQLPYEKFKIHDENSTNSIEVWVESSESSKIFDEIYHHKELNHTKVSVTGTIAGFDMPVMGGCLRGIKIILVGASDICF